MSHPAKDRVAEVDVLVRRPPKSHRAEGGTSRFVLACYVVGFVAATIVVAAVLFSLSQ